jgi:uncharacterized protein YbcV (DUF1398 family)
MFTLIQIKQAHDKVKSGADFPAYIKEIKALGITSYETYVADGHTDYHGQNDFVRSTKAEYDILSIAENTNGAHFKSCLKAHQLGNTDYLTFCKGCAESGIVKWVVSMEKMICTYLDKGLNVILSEQIPQ